MEFVYNVIINLPIYPVNLMGSFVPIDARGITTLIKDFNWVLDGITQCRSTLNEYEEIPAKVVE